MDDAHTRSNPPYVESPKGIFTVNGYWYHTSEKDLIDYAGGVLKHEPIVSLLGKADTWQRVASTLVLWISLILLWKVNAFIALGVAMTSYVILEWISPILISHWAFPTLKVLNNVLVQAAAYVVFLSYLGQEGKYVSLLAGFFIFISLRWRLWDALFQPLVRWGRNKLYAVPFEDKILKNVILKAALNYHVPIKELDEIDQSIKKIIRSK